MTACDSKSSFALPRACVSATTGQDLNICQNVKQCPGCRVERADTFSITMYICIDNCAIQHQVSGDYIARFSFSRVSIIQFLQDIQIAIARVSARPMCTVEGSGQTASGVQLPLLAAAVGSTEARTALARLG